MHRGVGCRFSLPHDPYRINPWSPMLLNAKHHAKPTPYAPYTRHLWLQLAATQIRNSRKTAHFSTYVQYRKPGESALVSAHTLHVHSAKNGLSINIVHGVAFGSTNRGVVMNSESVVHQRMCKNRPVRFRGKWTLALIVFHAIAAGYEHRGFVTEGESAGFRPEYTHGSLTILRG